jgi:hypothetical protein
MTSCGVNTADERLFKALTGLSRKEFRRLLSAFRDAYEERRRETYHANRAKRKRQPGGGQKGMLTNRSATLSVLVS